MGKKATKIEDGKSASRKGSSDKKHSKGKGSSKDVRKDRSLKHESASSEAIGKRGVVTEKPRVKVKATAGKLNEKLSRKIAESLSGVATIAGTPSSSLVTSSNSVTSNSSVSGKGHRRVRATLKETGGGLTEATTAERESDIASPVDAPLIGAFEPDSKGDVSESFGTESLEPPEPLIDNPWCANLQRSFLLSERSFERLFEIAQANGRSSAVTRDLLLVTHELVGLLGGKLTMVAQFPDRPPVLLPDLPPKP